MPGRSDGFGGAAAWSVGVVWLGLPGGAGRSPPVRSAATPCVAAHTRLHRLLPAPRTACTACRYVLARAASFFAEAMGLEMRSIHKRSVQSRDAVLQGERASKHSGCWRGVAGGQDGFRWVLWLLVCLRPPMESSKSKTVPPPL